MKPDKIYCINLDRRPDRWQSVSEQFRLHNLRVERFAAIDAQLCGITPVQAFTRSHYEVIAKSQQAAAKSVLIFEDDAVLHPIFNQLLEESMAVLPDAWDMLYFGGTHRQKPIPINQMLMRVQYTLTTHAYILRHTMFSHVLQLLEKTTEPADVIFANLQKDYNCFVTNPPIAWQAGGFSDIEGRPMFYPWIRTNKQ